MTQMIVRYWLVLSLGIALSACQSPVAQISEPAIDEFAVSEQVFEIYLESDQLALAGEQLEVLRHQFPDDQRVIGAQQRLASAWLQSGQQALQQADVGAATTALMHAKRLLPQAPALTAGLGAALAEVQAQASKPALESQTKQAPVKRVQPLPVKKAENPSPPVAPVQTDPPLIEPPEPKIEAPVETKPSRKKARVLDLDADHTILPMPMLTQRNDHQLGRFLDDVAADVVRFRASVRIEVEDTRDFHWVATLLSARVKKLDANFKPRLDEVIRNDVPAQLVITPNKSL